MCIFAVILGCNSKKSYNIGADKVIADLTTRIASLDEDLQALNNDLEDVKKALKDKDIDTELRKSLRKEKHEADKHAKDINQWIAYMKIQRKQRYKSLIERKSDENFAERAKKEVKEYFVQKDLKPIPKKWKNRYRTAIEF